MIPAVPSAGIYFALSLHRPFALRQWRLWAERISARVSPISRLGVEFHVDLQISMTQTPSRMARFCLSFVALGCLFWGWGGTWAAAQFSFGRAAAPTPAPTAASAPAAAPASPASEMEFIVERLGELDRLIHAADDAATTSTAELQGVPIEELRARAERLRRLRAVYQNQLDTSGEGQSAARGRVN